MLQVRLHTLLYFMSILFGIWLCILENMITHKEKNACVSQTGLKSLTWLNILLQLQCLQNYDSCRPCRLNMELWLCSLGKMITHKEKNACVSQTGLKSLTRLNILLQLQCLQNYDSCRPCRLNMELWLCTLGKMITHKKRDCMCFPNWPKKFYVTKYPSAGAVPAELWFMLTLQVKYGIMTLYSNMITLKEKNASVFLKLASKV